MLVLANASPLVVVVVVVVVAVHAGGDILLPSSQGSSLLDAADPAYCRFSLAIQVSIKL